MDAFQELYRSDAFYNWFGLGSPLMYAAHRAAGGMTSIYRQIGIGCERLFRQILIDELGLSPDEARWSHKIPARGGRNRTLYLDGRIPINAIENPERRDAVEFWINRNADKLEISRPIKENLKGVVFEVRQGYKSKDSKRQNADIVNATAAYTNAYLPCVSVLSGQIDEDIEVRYRREKWAVLTGAADFEDDVSSVYAFMKHVVGYDLAAFFERNSGTFREELDRVLRSLLETGET